LHDVLKSSCHPGPQKSEGQASARATKALNEMYIIQPWHNVVLLLVAVLLHLPFLIDDLVHPSFQVHPTGAVVITGA
jgi:hypothetical protein